VRPGFSALWAGPARWSVESAGVDLILRSFLPFAFALIRPSRNASASSRVPKSATIFRVRRLTTMKSFKAPNSGSKSANSESLMLTKTGSSTRDRRNEGAYRDSTGAKTPPEVETCGVSSWPGQEIAPVPDASSARCPRSQLTFSSAGCTCTPHRCASCSGIDHESRSRHVRASVRATT
jgi:hypothetical protein